MDGGGGLIHSISDGEKQLLDLASAGDASAAKSLIERYLKLLFGFVISFAPYSREQAFTITVASFARTLRRSPQVARDGEWMLSLFREGLAECIRTAPAGSTESPNEQLRFVREALIRLSAVDKATLLFRDQCHFPFTTVGALLGTDADRSRSDCLAARERLRDAVKEVIEKRGSGS